jgi:hypothetical protein
MRPAATSAAGIGRGAGGCDTEYLSFDFIHDWDEAARSASFPWFEPVRPAPDLIEAGSRGQGPDGVNQLGVRATFPTGTAEVLTVRLDRAVRFMASRRRRLDSLFGHAITDDDVALPLTITVEQADRVVDVDGRPVQFDGEQIRGAGWWVGTAVLDDAAVHIVADGCTIEALVRCGPHAARR